jgi:hypothetical protein
MMELDPNWEFVADTIMGGVSRGQVAPTQVAGRAAMRLTGEVSTDNGGGFIQMAFDFAQDASDHTGIALDVCGNGQRYDLRLRTTRLIRAWQSFRCDFTAPAAWTTITVPFAMLVAHRTEAVFDPSELRRVGVVAVGREFAVDVAVSGVRLV